MSLFDIISTSFLFLQAEKYSKLYVYDLWIENGTPFSGPGPGPNHLNQKLAVLSIATENDQYWYFLGSQDWSWSRNQSISQHQITHPTAKYHSKHPTTPIAHTPHISSLQMLRSHLHLLYFGLAKK